MKLGYCGVTRIGDLNAQLKKHELEVHQYKGEFRIAPHGGDFFTCDWLFTALTKREVLVWLAGYEYYAKAMEVKECEI
jgi:hypothetical protein